jgi:plastocyanin
MKNGILLFLAVFVLMAFSSCVSTTTSGNSSSGCASGLAQIQVGDGFLEILCGCQEAGGVVVGTPANITCTVPSGTVVLFLYLGTELEHQIVSSGGLSFPSSSVSNPQDPNPIRTAAAQFTASGTYDFQDAFNQGIQGKIVVP